MRLQRKSSRIILVIATRQHEALEAINQIGGLPIERREALTTAGLYQALKGAHLAIVDLSDVAESPDFSRERMQQVLAQTLSVTGAEFVANSAQYLDRARATSGLSGALPPRCIAFAGLSGGVGKSTLSLSLARFFHHKTGLPTAVIELSTGPSGILALLAKDDQDWSHLYEVVSQGKPWPTWEGITLAGMAWDTARLLSEDRVRSAWRAIQEQHILTVVDAPAYHPHWPIIAALVDRVLVVSDGRPDALANAAWLLQHDAPEGNAHSEVLLNRGGLAAKLALPFKPIADLPDVGRAAQSFPSQLGSRLMSIVYPGWKV